MKKQENKISENWDHIKETLKKRYPFLTENDLQYELGQEEELVNRLEKKLNTTRSEIMDLLEEGYLGTSQEDQ